MNRWPIVVAYDGSASATAAQCWALDEGVRRGLPVRLVYVLDPQAPLPHPRRWNDRRQAHERVLRRIAADAYDWGLLGIEVSAMVLDGPAGRALLEQSRHASLLVVGERGREGFTGQRIGSVTLQVAAYAQCPVAVVRQAVYPASRRPIAVGVDDSAAARLAVDIALQEAAMRGVDLIAIRAAGASSPWALAEDRRQLAAVVDQGTALYPSVRITTRLIRRQPGHALTVASRDVQLMVVGSRGSGGFPELALGATSLQLLRHGLCSVEITRPSATLLRTAEGHQGPVEPLPIAVA